MAQADQTIANATFPSVRADINDNLAALFSNNLGASSPSTTTGGMWWLDTTNNCLKIRSEDNNNWYALSKTDGTQLFGSGTTAALPAFSKYDDVNTGMFFPAADTVAIATNGSEALRIDDSGNVHIGGTAESQSDSFSFMTNGTGGTYLNFNMDGRTSAVTGASGCYIYSGSGSSGDFPAGTLVLQSRSNLNRDIAFVTGSSPSIKMIINSSGDLFLGTGGSQVSSTVEGISTIHADNDYWILNIGNSRTTSQSAVRLFNGNGLVGTINTTGSSTSYNTSSDYRLKENVKPITDGLSRLMELKPSRFNFISDQDTFFDGFLAHEAQAVVPEAVIGEKDDIDEEGNPDYQGIDQSKLVPLLVAAVQDLKKEIDKLKNKK